MLDGRKKSILEAVVSEYITTGEPVSSAHIANGYAIDCSPATVRADMASLERDGYLTHPHTSAGRIPTDLGYRFYVDSLDDKGTSLDIFGAEKVANFFAKTHFELEKMLSDTSMLLSNLTDYAAVVVAPESGKNASIRSLLLTKITAHTAVLVVVLSSGNVDKYNVEISDFTSEDDIAKINLLLNSHLANKYLTGLPEIKTDDPHIESVITKCLQILSDTTEEGRADDTPIFVGGTSRMASQFAAIQRVREILSILEQSYVVVTLLKEVLAKGLKVSIGTENEIDSLSDCALVVAPYQISDSVFGTLAVLGPKRMHYKQVLAAVETVGTQLSNQLRND